MEQSLLQCAVVSGVHGLRGELVVRPFDPASEALSQCTRAVARLRDGTRMTLKLESVRPHRLGTRLVHVHGVTNRTQATPLHGATLFVFREDLPAPAPGEYFQGDLIGLSASSDSGEYLGEVTGLESYGPTPNVVIRHGDSELVVPFAEDFVVEVDLADGRIIVRVPQPFERLP